MMRTTFTFGCNTLNKSFIEEFAIKSDDYSDSSHHRDDKMLHKGLTASKSSPNLSDVLDKKGKRCTSPVLHKNRSTDFMNSPLLMNPHKALMDLYKKYSGNKGDVFRRSFSLRTRKMKSMQDIYNYCNEENTFTVNIRKRANGLGLCIYGGKDATRKDPFQQLIRIWNLHPMQPALECGKLTLGDVILEVNGTSVLGLTNSEAVEVLRSAPTNVELKIFRPAKYLLPPFPEFKDSVCPDSNVSCSSASKTALCADHPTSSVQSGEFKVDLTKKDDCLGFTIARIDNAKDLTGGIFIKALTREHAISDGRIHPGDRILQVDGMDISGLSQSEAIACLRNTSENVVLKICRSCKGWSSCPNHCQPKVHTFNVTVDKSPNENLGFCVWDYIDGLTDAEKNLLPCAAEVKVVYPSSIAQNNGIKVGDRILEVNGESLIGKTADEVIDVLRKTNGVIRMVFCRL